MTRMSQLFTAFCVTSTLLSSVAVAGEPNEPPRREDRREDRRDNRREDRHQDRSGPNGHDNSGRENHSERSGHGQG